MVIRKVLSGLAGLVLISSCVLPTREVEKGVVKDNFFLNGMEYNIEESPSKRILNFSKSEKNGEETKISVSDDEKDRIYEEASFVMKDPKGVYDPINDSEFSKILNYAQTQKENGNFNTINGKERTYEIINGKIPEGLYEGMHYSVINGSDGNRMIHVHSNPSLIQPGKTHIYASDSDSDGTYETITSNFLKINPNDSNGVIIDAIDDFLNSRNIQN